MDRLLHNRIGLVFALLIIVFFTQIFSLMSSGNQIDKINYIKKEIANNQLVVDSIYKVNKKLDKQIISLNYKIKNLDNNIDANNDKIDKLKKDGKIQVDNFKHFNASMWEKYFTDRYSKK